MICTLRSKGGPWTGFRLGMGLVLSVFCFISVPSQATAQHSFIGIGTGGSTGVYFLVGNMICTQMQQESADGRQHRIRCIPVSTGGSVDNIRLLRADKLDFGIVQSDVLYHAFTGTARFAGNEFKNLRTVFALHSEAFHILAHKGSGIASWGDLKGKKVNIGSPGSGVRATFEELMGAFRIDKEFFGHAFELTTSEQMNAMCRGSIDAFGYIVGVPNESVAHAIRECEATLVPLDMPEVRKLVSERPYFDSSNIPAKSYPNLSKDIRTLGVIATMVTTADQDQQIVYELVRAVFENIDHIRQMHPAFAALDPTQMACRGHLAPLHEGAKKYFSERGLNVCP